MNLSHRVLAVIWVSLGPSYICLGVPGEMVCDHQNILIQALPRFQAQIVKVNQLQRMCGHDAFQGGFWLPGFEGKTLGNTSQGALLPGQPCKARRTYHTWGQACIPGPNDQPHHGILLEQPPFVQLAEPTGGGSPLILWAGLICTDTLFEQQIIVLPLVLTDFRGVCCLGLAFP